MSRDGSSIAEEGAFGNSDVGSGRVGIGLGFVDLLLGSRESELAVYGSFAFSLQIRSARTHSEYAALANDNRALVGECPYGSETLTSLEVKATLGGIGDKPHQGVRVGIQNLRSLPGQRDFGVVGGDVSGDLERTGDVIGASRQKAVRKVAKRVGVLQVDRAVGDRNYGAFVRKRVATTRAPADVEDSPLGSVNRPVVLDVCDAVYKEHQTAGAGWHIGENRPIVDDLVGQDDASRPFDRGSIGECTVGAEVVADFSIIVVAVVGAIPHDDGTFAGYREILPVGNLKESLAIVIRRGKDLYSAAVVQRSLRLKILVVNDRRSGVIDGTGGSVK